VIIAAVGQMMRTTAGMLSGWISSMVMASAPLIGPPDRMVTGSLGFRSWLVGSRARWELPLLAGHLWSVVLILVWSAVSPQKVRSTLIRGG
jgi:hypothetical protein